MAPLKVKFRTVQGKVFDLELEDDTKVSRSARPVAGVVRAALLSSCEFTV
jgi:hypothetical protein